jgi:phosphoglycolate phosphatase-like HAD superfamily hydrolase
VLKGDNIISSVHAVIFDFDGVLAESFEVKTRAYTLLFANETEEAVCQFVDYHIKNGGISRFEKIKMFYRDILQRPLSEKRFQELVLRFSSLVVDEVVAAPWVEGALEFLNQNEKKYKFFIVSGTPEDELNEIVRRRGMGHYFNAVRGSPKDKVTLLGEIMKEYNLRPGKMVFIGDAETDWNAAQELGLPFLWRCVSGQDSLLSGYAGPRLSSLKELDINLKQAVSS